MSNGDDSTAKKVAEASQLQLSKYTVCEWAQVKVTEIMIRLTWQ